MAQYTLTLQEIIDSGIDIFAGYTFPIFDESYREQLKQKFIRHFYFREIGVETIAHFIYNLNTKLNEIMPIYNKMYMAQGLDQRILDNYSLSETYTRTTDSTENGSNKKLFSDTPQGRTTLAASDYVTEITEDSETGGNSSNENYTLTRTGNIGIQTDANAVEQYMNSLRNVDLMLFKELNEMFMQVY